MNTDTRTTFGFFMAPQTKEPGSEYTRFESKTIPSGGMTWTLSDTGLSKPTTGTLSWPGTETTTRKWCGTSYAYLY